MVTFIQIVITRVKNGSLTAFERKLDEKKIRYLPGFVDLICFRIFNIGNLRVDINYKNGHKWSPRGFPRVRNWHAPYYHIPKHFCYAQRGSILIKYSSFYCFLGVIKLPKYYIQVSRVPKLIPSQKKLTFSLTSSKKVGFFAGQPKRSRFVR